MLAKFVFMLFVISSQLEGAVGDNFRRGHISYNGPPLARRHAACWYFPKPFVCSDGTCIAADRKCDGNVDCPDGSDETYHLCRETPCADYMFRCMYGACVDGTAPCNGVSDCADNSDELQPECNNHTFEIGSQFECNDSSLIERDRRCDGIRDCADGTDETLAACAGTVCASNLFQCAYGACVDEGADCNDIVECADGSDESDKLCNRTVPRTTTTTTTTPTTPSTMTVGVPNMCVLPPHPENGQFVKIGASAEYRVGDVAESVFFNITCSPGYKVVGEPVAICYSGLWLTGKLPSCVRACSLKPSDSVEYRCLLGDKETDGTRDCEELEVLWTAVKPECRRPNYYSPTPLPKMYCTDNGWSYEPTCQSECGTPTPRAKTLVKGGREFPWHVGLYRLSDDDRYELICGGSIISEWTVATAAHCVWVDEIKAVLPLEYFMVAAGKKYRQLDDQRDKRYQQTSRVSAIHVPEQYGGADLYYQNDLAVIKLRDRFVYRIYIIRPVCLDYSLKFDEYQLKKGNIGRAAGWGLTRSRRGSESTELKVSEMQYMEWRVCKERIPPEYLGMLVNDKFCAASGNGTTLCKGDSGSGLVFCEREHGEERCYLRGVLSTGPPRPDGGGCDPDALTSFTHVQKHERFLRRHLADDPRV